MTISTRDDKRGPGRWAALALVLGLVGCQPEVLAPAKTAEPVPAPTMSEQLAASLEAELGRKAVPAIRLDNRLEGWRFICGRPEELTGDAFDYGSSRLAEAAAEGLVDDSFCALFETTSDGDRLREFFVGSTDTPVFDWMERYELPGDIFSE
ncbi:MAG: hypothetical protein OEU92_17655 [Alphaproteobacteria bacterium]|nr:hypothetical protein [Alphaproteobacteria bacterium]